MIASMRSDSAVFSLPDSPSGLTFAAKLTIFSFFIPYIFLFFKVTAVKMLLLFYH